MPDQTADGTNQSILIVGGIALAVLPFNFLRGPHKIPFSAALIALFGLSQFWQSQVTKIVPEPYLVRPFPTPHFNC